MDLDLRKLRYFVAVAQELHFGRAAERLHIAQPVLSRQIRSLEDDLGTEVFDRGRRGTVLTAAGEQLLEDAVPLLASAEALTRRVAAAARETPTLTVGFMPGITLTPATSAFSARHPEVHVRLLRTTWDDQARVLLDGRADIGVVRLPVDPDGLRIRPLFREPRVVVLPAGHRLAERASLTVRDLAPEHLLQDPDAVPEWRDAAAAPRPRRGAAPVVHQVEEKVELVASGAGVCVLPLSTAAFYTRPDVVARPVDGLGPNEVAVAWAASRRSPLVHDFADAAVRTLDGPRT